MSKAAVTDEGPKGVVEEETQSSSKRGVLKVDETVLANHIL